MRQFQFALIGAIIMAFSTGLVQAIDLRVAGECPGLVVIHWSNAEPNRPMGIVYALERGAAIIESGPCAGVQLGLGTRQLQSVHRRSTGRDGSGQIGGRTWQNCVGFVQLVVASSRPPCSTSNVEPIP